MCLRLLPKQEREMKEVRAISPGEGWCPLQGLRSGSTPGNWGGKWVTEDKLDRYGKETKIYLGPTILNDGANRKDVIYLLLGHKKWQGPNKSNTERKSQELREQKRVTLRRDSRSSKYVLNRSSFSKPQVETIAGTTGQALLGPKESQAKWSCTPRQIWKGSAEKAGHIKCHPGETAQKNVNMHTQTK